jgi:hypothetical protein
MARRRKGERPQANCNTITAYRGIGPEAKLLISCIQDVVRGTSGEIITAAVEALVWVLAHDARLPEKRRQWVLKYVLPNLKILPLKYLGPEEYQDGSGI